MKTKDMTTGRPLELILRFAIPLLIGNIFQQIYSLADTMIVGYSLGDSAIAAIGATSSLYSLIINFANGLNNGYAIVVTQKFGSHSRRQLKKSVAVMAALNAAGAVILTTAALLLLNPALRFLNTPGHIYGQARIYIAVICGGMSATLLYNMFAGFLRAVGNSRTQLYFLIAASVLNVALDVLFVIVLGLGVSGAAFATVLAQAASAALCGRYIWKNYREYLPGKGDFAADKKMYFDMFSTGISMAMMHCIFAIGSVILQSAVNSLGDTIITAHTAARRIVEMFMHPLAAVATATSVFVGQNWGAGKAGRIKTALKQSLGVEVLMGVLGAAFAFCFAGRCVMFVTGTTDSEVIKNAVMNLRINFFFYPALGVLLCLRMAMQAMGQKIAPLISSSLELTGKVVSSIFLIPAYGYAAASFTEPSTWLACMLLLGCLFLCGGTKKLRREDGE